jgi:hypothetical protein
VAGPTTSSSSTQAIRIDRLEDEGGLDHGRADPVRVNVGSGTTIFQVSLALDIDRSGNSDRGTSIYSTDQGNSPNQSHERPTPAHSTQDSPETPAVNVVAEAVSCFPVRRLSLSSP